jgi:hypothetical protein
MKTAITGNTAGALPTGLSCIAGVAPAAGVTAV